MSLPEISVIMPVYNEEKYVKEAVESILNQTFTKFEFIIVNDGATDGSQNIIDSFGDSRIISLFNESNLGISESLNKGIKFAKGKYIARMDANDVANETRFEKQVSYLDNNNVGLVGTQYELIDEDSNTIGKGSHRYFAPDQTISYLAFYNICHASIMMKKEIL